MVGTTVRYIDSTSFEEVAGENGQLIVVILPSGGYEIVAPQGAEVDENDVPDTQMTALLSLRSASYYEKCKNGFVYVCCNGICRKKSPPESC